MSKVLFTEEQVKKLEKNPYVKNVSDKTITYTDEFKEIFIERINNNERPYGVFRDMGFDVKVIGEHRINSTTKRFKKFAERDDGFKDTRKGNSGRPCTRDLTPEEEIAKLKHRNLVLEQENIFLKKMIFLGKKYSQKSQHRKNSK